MANRYSWLLCSLVFLMMLTPAIRAGEEPLPIGLTDEEMTRLDEIGINHVTTAPPPTTNIRNSSEWEPMQGVIIR